MPVKRRTAKRRIDPKAEAEAWACMLQCGFDFFDDLPGIGVETDQYSRAPLDLAEDAWRRLGHLITEATWAAKQFGEHHAE